MAYYETTTQAQQRRGMGVGGVPFLDMLTPFMIFCAEHRKDVIQESLTWAETDRKDPTLLGRALVNRWKALTLERRKFYVDMFDKDRMKRRLREERELYRRQFGTNERLSKRPRHAKQSSSTGPSPQPSPSPTPSASPKSSAPATPTSKDVHSLEAIPTKAKKKASPAASPKPVSDAKEMGAGKKRKRKVRKRDPNAPKNPLAAYMHFSRSNRPRLRHENPKMDFSELGRLTGEAWREMNDEQKAPYKVMATEDKMRYKREHAAYMLSKQAADFKAAQESSVLNSDSTEGGLSTSVMQAPAQLSSRKKMSSPRKQKIKRAKGSRGNGFRGKNGQKGRNATAHQTQLHALKNSRRERTESLASQLDEEAESVLEDMLDSYVPPQEREKERENSVYAGKPKMNNDRKALPPEAAGKSKDAFREITENEVVGNAFEDMEN